ncbi:MAG: GNAT family N-acetyltransferase [Chloroflexota bacterium]|nr:GNAT family N-acetyltransferase [Chloroflexota bacterium]MED5568574.1 GNAT family N-acetyltransferase [Chloroflexota bacterium]
MEPKPLTSFHEIEAEWEGVLTSSPVNTVFLTPQWQEVWWDTFGDGKDMAGFYIPSSDGQGDGGSIDGLASLTLSGDILSFVGNQETVDYNDFMVRPGHESDFYQTLLTSLKDRRWDVMRLDSLVENSPTLAHLPELARQQGYSVEIEKEDTASGIELPSTWDEYLAILSKKDRHELRRKFRRLEAVPDWKWYAVTGEEEVMSRLDDFVRLMRQSSQEKDEYMTEEHLRFFYAMARRMSQIGLLRLYFLELDGKPVATSLCFDYASSRLLYNSGYDLEYGYYSVGLLLNALCLREAIEQEIGYFDFLRGSETYKHHLGGQPHDLYQMVVRRS